MPETRGGELQPGSRLGPYEILSALGAGGMGVVYRAHDPRLGRDVAIKLLPAHLGHSAEATERLRREARAIGALEHPNICAIHDVGETAEGQVFLVMELLGGETLSQTLRRGALPIDAALDAGIALAGALATAHAAGIIHRDIKPANIFVTEHGPKLLDFGLAKAFGRAGSELSTAGLLTEPGGVVGTIAYMSPEQLRGAELDGRADVFSLGLVLYEMVTGARAFAGGTSPATAAAILHEPPKPARSINAAVPVSVDACIMRAIEKPLEVRYQSAADLRSALLHARGSGVAAPVATRRTNRLPIGVAVAIVIAVLVTAGYLSRSRPAPLAERDSMVIADFRNTTGDDVFDDALRQGLSVQLQQSPFVTIVPDARIRRTLTMMGQSPDAPLTMTVAAEVCERTGSAAVLEGSIAQLGSRYIVGLRATGCADDAVIDAGQREVDRKEDVLRAVGELAGDFRQRSGESLASRQRFDTPLVEATTSSLEALKAYSAGRRVNESGGLAAAVPLWKRAVDIDPKFGTAWAFLGLSYNMIGETDLAIEAATAAYAVRNRTTDRERFMIEALYERQVTGNLDQARQTFETWVATYPRDIDGLGLLAGFSTQGTGRYEQTIATAEQALSVDPDHGYSFLNLAGANIYLDRIADAERALQRAVDRGVEMPDVLVTRYQLSYLKGDRAGMARDAAAGRKHPGAADRVAHFESLIAARDGHLAAARASAQEAIALAQQAGHRGTAAVYYAGTAIWEAFAGQVGPARKAADTALALSDGRDATYAAAFALARIGDHSRAAQLATALQRRFPGDTSVRYNYLPTLRALDALHSRDPQKALTILEEARTYELAVSAVAFNYLFGSLYPPFVRAEAYLALGRKAEAQSEFERILQHRGLLLADPVGAVIERELKALGAMRY